MAVIFYFSGTGNSLDVAKQAQAVFNNSYIENVAQYLKQPYHVKDEIIGIVCPVYCFDIPPVVQEFLKNLQAQPKYCFSIVTMGANQGRALKHLQELLLKNNIELNYADTVIMPDNFFVTPASKAKLMLTEADKKIRHIVTCLYQRRFDTSQCKEQFLWKYAGIPLGWWLMRSIQRIGHLSVDVQKCINCGQCVKVCPVNNIELKYDKPVFGDKCVACFACVRWCPKNAIKNGNKGASAVKNYTNPNIKIQELFNTEGKR